MPKYVLVKCHMQKLQGFKVLSVDDPKSTQEVDVNVVTHFQSQHVLIVQKFSVLVLARRLILALFTFVKLPNMMAIVFMQGM